MKPGKEEPAIVTEPLHDPLPQKEPSKRPAEPLPVPEHEPVALPAWPGSQLLLVRNTRESATHQRP